MGDLHKKEYGAKWRKKNKEKILMLNKMWRRAHPEYIRRKNKIWASGHPIQVGVIRRRYHLKSNYGISMKTYDKMLKKQNGVCAICKQKNGKKVNLKVDHNHNTGQVRDLLCDNCNFAIGHSKENPSILRKMAQYLEKHNNKKEITK